MNRNNFFSDLSRYGPGIPRVPSCTQKQARIYCRKFSRSHYENFLVTGWLIPRSLRQHFYNIYAYCRWSDNLADEVKVPDQRIPLLDWWEQQLETCYNGQAEHPVFVALAETIREFGIPIQPLRDLLTAFRQDQKQVRYQTFQDLLGYCQNSANPVGRLILYLGRCHRSELLPWSDSICTGLQLANFCQDIARDFDLGRIYIPVESWNEFGYAETDFKQRKVNKSFQAMLSYEVDRAEAYLVAGRPLVTHVPRGLSIQVNLFIEGGRSILKAIRKRNYDVWSHRPTVGALTKLRSLFNAWRAIPKS